MEKCTCCGGVPWTALPEASRVPYRMAILIHITKLLNDRNVAEKDRDEMAKRLELMWLNENPTVDAYEDHAKLEIFVDENMMS
jgi:hypothetical protein